MGVNSRIFAGLKVVVEALAEDSPVSAANIGDEAAWAMVRNLLCSSRGDRVGLTFEASRGEGWRGGS